MKIAIVKIADDVNMKTLKNMITENDSVIIAGSNTIDIVRTCQAKSMRKGSLSEILAAKPEKVIFVGGLDCIYNGSSFADECERHGCFTCAVM